MEKTMTFNKILKVLLASAALLLAMLLAVGCGDTPDPTPDGSDEQGGGAEESPYLDLTKDGEVLFTLVYDSSDALIKAEADKLVSKFAEKGLTVKTAELSDKSKITDCEILVGKTFPGRSEYEYDTVSLGAEGYTYFAKGNKIVVTGGSSEFIAKALSVFTNDVLRVDSTSSDINNINVERTLSMVKPQSYRITSVTINGTPISEYRIVVSSDSSVRSAAGTFKSGLYQYTGNDLSIEETTGSHNIFFELVDNAGKTGYRVKVDANGDLHVECSFKNSFQKGTESFVSSLLVRGRGDIVIDKKYEYTTEVSKIYYKDFGAVGDGETDDFMAIKTAHEFANDGGYTVVAEDGATYHMGAHSTSIIIKTDVIWTGARFIIDDSNVETKSAVSKTNIFHIAPSLPSQEITTISSLSKGQTNIGVTFDQPMLVYICDVENDDRRVYIRYGGNANSGSLRQEIILVNENGDVDPSTPILFDYPELGSVKAYPAGEKPITIKGGTFITIANRAPREYNYYNRGFYISRSNTTITKMTHYVQGETDTGAPYSGFLSTSQANNVVFDSIVFTGHKVYRLLTDSSNSMGTYEIGGSNANNLVWRNCTQTNDINDSSYWGVMGTNFCKNLTYDGCKLSRFDAHQGMHNTTIINSELGHQKINAIGSGLLRIEDCIVNGTNVVVLRSDYGSTWEGDVIIKNVQLNNTTDGATVFGATWYNHYFGYTCYLPQNITIDNLTTKNPGVIFIFPALSADIDKPTVNGVTNNNPIVLPKTVTISNMKSDVVVSSNTALFADVVVIKNK